MLAVVVQDHEKAVPSPTIDAGACIAGTLVNLVSQIHL